MVVLCSYNRNGTEKKWCKTFGEELTLTLSSNFINMPSYSNGKLTIAGDDKSSLMQHSMQRLLDL